MNTNTSFDNTIKDSPKHLPWWKRVRITRDPEPEILPDKVGFTRDTVIENGPPKGGRLRITMLPNAKKKKKEKKEGELEMTFIDHVEGCGCLLFILVFSIGATWGLIVLAESLAH